MPLLQAEVDFAADGATDPSPRSAFVTCASALTEGGHSSSHADDTRGLMTAVLLGGISQDDLTVRPRLCLPLPACLPALPFQCLGVTLCSCLLAPSLAVCRAASLPAYLLCPCSSHLVLKVHVDLPVA